MIVSAPFSSTTAPVRAAAARAGGDPIRAGAPNARANSPACGVSTAAPRKRLGLAGEGREHIGVRDDPATGRQQHRQRGACRIRPEPGPHTQTLRRSSSSSSASGASLTSTPGDAGAIDVAARRSPRCVTSPAPPRRAASAASRAAPVMVAPPTTVTWPRRILVRLRLRASAGATAPAGWRSRSLAHRCSTAVGQADIGQHRLAAQLAPRQQQMPGLEPEEGHRQRRLRRIAAHRAGGAIEPARHIHRDHAPRRAQRIGDDARPHRAPGRRRTPHRSPAPRAPPPPG